MLTPVASQHFEFSFRKILASVRVFVRAMTSVAHVRITKTETIVKLQLELAVKDIEIAKLKEEIKALNLQITGCSRCCGYASGEYGKHCEECYFTHMFRKDSQ